jgi:hypothetical protein
MHEPAHTAHGAWSSVIDCWHRTEASVEKSIQLLRSSDSLVRWCETFGPNYNSPKKLANSRVQNQRRIGFNATLHRHTFLGIYGPERP